MTGAGGHIQFTTCGRFNIPVTRTDAAGASVSAPRLACLGGSPFARHRAQPLPVGVLPAGSLPEDLAGHLGSQTLPRWPALSRMPGEGRCRPVAEPNHIACGGLTTAARRRLSSPSLGGRRQSFHNSNGRLTDRNPSITHRHVSSVANDIRRAPWTKNARRSVEL